MRKLLGLILLIGIVYFGYNFYHNYNSSKSISTMSSPVKLSALSVKNSGIDLENVQHVLGASAENLVDTGKSWLSDATGGASEPIVNRAISNFQTELMQLPAEQVEKIKYDFCKPIVTEYEKKVGAK